MLEFRPVNIVLRAANENDSEQLLRWRNDPLTRANSVSTHEITAEEHERWLREVLLHKGLSIAYVNDEPVGTVRFDARADGYDISFAVAPEHRGHGYGSAILEQALLGIHGRVTARVKLSNLPSQHIFRKLGFRQVGEKDELLMFAKDC